MIQSELEAKAGKPYKARENSGKPNSADTPTPTPLIGQDNLHLHLKFRESSTSGRKSKLTQLL